MRKVILVLLLAGMSSSAAAQWLVINDDGFTTIYVNPATIRKTGNMVKMWTLYNYQSAQDPQYSSKEQKEFDCKERQKRARVLSFSLYSGYMGRGELINSDTNPSTWSLVRPGSNGDSMWKIACGKR